MLLLWLLAMILLWWILDHMIDKIDRLEQEIQKLKRLKT